MAQDRAYPPISRELLARLEEDFSDRLPHDPVSAEQLARLVGRQDIIRKMRSEMNRQTGGDTLAIVKV